MKSKYTIVLTFLLMGLFVCIYHLNAENNSVHISSPLNQTNNYNIQNDLQDLSTIPSLRPDYLAEDRYGNLYLINQFRSQILKVTPDKNILVIAGNGVSGFSGDNGKATSASLNWPECVVVEKSGIIYIADTRNHRIRKIENNIITTIAGNGIPGNSGDGGIAISASLNFPTGIAISPQTNHLYIADNHNHRIRKIDQQGIISTITETGEQKIIDDSTQETTQKIFFPNKIICLPDERLLFFEKDFSILKASSDTDSIREISTNGIISTVTAPPEFFSVIEPSEIAVDDSRLRRKRTFPTETSLPAPYNLTHTNLSFDSVFILWSYSGGGGPRFEIERKEINNNDIIDTKTFNVSSSETWYNDNNENNSFEPDHTYTYKVRACVSIDCYGWSNEISVPFVNNPPQIRFFDDHETDEDKDISINFRGCDS